MIVQQRHDVEIFLLLQLQNFPSEFQLRMLNHSKKFAQTFSFFYHQTPKVNPPLGRLPVKYRNQWFGESLKQIEYLGIYY